MPPSALHRGPQGGAICLYFILLITAHFWFDKNVLAELNYKQSIFHSYSMKNDLTKNSKVSKQVMELLIAII